MMCRINPTIDEVFHEKAGYRPMDFTGKTMKSYVFINDEGIKTKKAFEYWIDLRIEFNSMA